MKRLSTSMSYNRILLPQGSLGFLALAVFSHAALAVEVGNDLTLVPSVPGGDTGSVTIVDGYNSATANSDFVIPMDGVITATTILNDNDSDPEAVDLLVLRETAANSYTVIQRWMITDDTPVADTGSTTYPMGPFEVQEGDVLAHASVGNAPIPLDCCGSGPGDVQISFDATEVGGTLNFNPFPQARNYYWNVTLVDAADTDGDGMSDTCEQAAIDQDPDDAIATLADVKPDDDLDGDNLTNLQECTETLTDLLDADSDDDGLNDDVENGSGVFNGPDDSGTDPNVADTDVDGINDGDEVSDANGFITDPNKFDTDDDGLSDSSEIAAGTDPTNPNDPPPPSGGIVGNDLTTAAGDLRGDTGGAGTLLIDGFHNPVTEPNFTIPAGGGLLVAMTIQDDSDTTAEDVDLLVLRPTGSPNEYTVIHRVTVTDDDPTVAGNGSTSTTYPLPDLEVEEGDILGHWYIGRLGPIPYDCCGSGPADININLGSETVDADNTFVFNPFPQARSYYYNVTLDQGERGVKITDVSHDTSTGDLNLSWESKDGKLYTLRSELDPSNAEPFEWPVFGDHQDLAATPPENTLSFPLPDDSERFFVIEEFNAPPVSIFSEDFESGLGDWTVASDGADGTAWELGAPSNVGPAAAHSAANCFGTNLSADYGLDAQVSLRSPEIDLTTAGGATLRYYQFVDIEEGFDLGQVAILDAGDDSELDVLFPTVDGTTDGWEEVTKTLRAEVLGKTIKLEFRLTSDDLEAFAGWYLDDVEVTVP